MSEFSMFHKKFVCMHAFCMFCLHVSLGFWLDLWLKSRFRSQVTSFRRGQKGGTFMHLLPGVYEAQPRLLVRFPSLAKQPGRTYHGRRDLFSHPIIFRFFFKGSPISNEIILWVLWGSNLQSGDSRRHCSKGDVICSWKLKILFPEWLNFKVASLEILRKSMFTFNLKIFWTFLKSLRPFYNFLELNIRIVELLTRTAIFFLSAQIVFHWTLKFDDVLTCAVHYN